MSFDVTKYLEDVRKKHTPDPLSDERIAYIGTRLGYAMKAMSNGGVCEFSTYGIPDEEIISNFAHMSKETTEQVVAKITERRDEFGFNDAAIKLLGDYFNIANKEREEIAEGSSKYYKAYKQIMDENMIISNDGYGDGM